MFYGPTLPEPKPEEIAAQKIKKLESELADKVLAEIQGESPPDWKDTMPRALHTKPFKWNQRKPILPIWKELSEEKKAQPSSMALIAGVYSDSEEDDEEEAVGEEGQEGNKVVLGSKRKMHKIEVKAPPSKVTKTSNPLDSAGEKDEDGAKKAERRDKHGRKVYDSALGTLMFCKHFVGFFN